jgi:mannose-6-phosphate isomerase-like protein (cupin superfamily)
MNTPSDLLMKPGQGISLSVIGDILTFKAVSEDTNGQYTLIELRVDPKMGPPPHIYHRVDEAFYIQAGELEFQLGNKTVMATPGTFLYLPKGHPHTFRNISNQRAKMLVWSMPAGIERFFAEVGVPVDDPESLSRPANIAAIEQIVAAAPKYGIEFLA